MCAYTVQIPQYSTGQGVLCPVYFLTERRISMYYHYMIYFIHGQKMPFHTWQRSRAAAEKHLRSLGLTPGIDAIFQRETKTL